MGQYLLRRLLQSLVVLFAVTAIAFFVVYLTGDPVSLMAPPEATDEDRAQLRQALGLDQSLWTQYMRFLGNLARGDIGNSFRHGVPALPLTLSRLPATIELTVFSMAIALAVGVPVGILSAIKRNSVLDHLSRLVALFGQSMPVYWSGILLILLVSVRWGLLPASGRGTWQHLILPGLTLGLFSTAPITRLIRSSMLEVLNADYIRTARAKGLGETVVIMKHALRNAAIPAITMLGLQVGVLLGGAVVTETVFAWPGMGRFVVQAIYNRDFPVIRAAVLVFAVIIVGVNLVVDLLYGYLNPQIRYD